MSEVPEPSPSVEIGPVAPGAPPLRIGPGQPLAVIAGPCVLETPESALEIAVRLREITDSLGLPLIFKASFDKANRTSLSSFRGPGVERGLEILGQIRGEVGVPVTTDLHLPDQAGPVGEVCDLLQIPAFLARQTDLLLAAAATGRPVNVKKGQFMAPEDMRYAVDKLQGGGAAGVLLCERGTFFGYGRLVNDMTALVTMRALGVPVVFDATHSVQQPGGLGGATGGNRALVEPLARAAVAIGIDALFFETHPRPDESPSDGPNMLPLHQVPAVLQRLKKIRAAVEGEK